MKCKLVKILEISGDKASIYSVIINSDKNNLFEKFIIENQNSFKSELQDIAERLRTIGNKTGARLHFFKDKEGVPGDGVCALYDSPDKKLRLYCIRYGAQLIILGGGGEKNVNALQDDPKLKTENYILRDLSKKVQELTTDGDIKFINDGLDFSGELEFEIYDYE